MSDMMTKFKVSVQPHLDKGEEVLVVDGKTGEVRCRICPPILSQDITVDWDSHWKQQQRKPIKLNSEHADPISIVVNEGRDETRLFL